MHIVVIGAGGVGGYFGGRLSRAGARVSFLARGEHLAAIKADGLRVHSDEAGDFVVHAPAFSTLAGVPQADLVLFCVKGFDTPGAAEAMRPVVGPQTLVLPLQNGIDGHEKLRTLFGKGRILAGAAYVLAHIEAPGVIRHEKHSRIVMGPADPDVPAARLEEVCAVFRQAGIEAESSASIRRLVWEKYVFLTAFAGVSATSLLEARPLPLAVPRHVLWRWQVRELLNLAQAESVDLGDHAERDLIMAFRSLSPASMASMARDFKNGRAFELDALHGAALALAARHGLEAPALAAVHAALAPYAAGRPEPQDPAPPAV